MRYIYVYEEKTYFQGRVEYNAFSAVVRPQKAESMVTGNIVRARTTHRAFRARFGHKAYRALLLEGWVNL